MTDYQTHRRVQALKLGILDADTMPWDDLVIALEMYTASKQFEEDLLEQFAEDFDKRD